MRRRRIARAMLALTAMGSIGLSAQEPLSLDDVVARAAAYVETFVDDLSTVVMEEEYRQTYTQWGRYQTDRIVLRSEFLLVRIGGNGAWMGFRDIFEINGRRIRDRQDRLAALFLTDTPDALTQALHIAEESSRHNVGSTNRTTNVPTHALFYLHPTNTRRFRFAKNREGCNNEPTAWQVRFEEIEYPTLTRGFEGLSLRSTGFFCLDPMSGRVIATELELHHPAVGDGRPAVDMEARVEFALEAKLNLWVPYEMQETYFEHGRGTALSTAQYRNYRQFDVTVSENVDSEERSDGPD